MPKTIEFQGKTVESALESASGVLKIPEKEIQYEVITYGSTGIFGLIGVKKAVIRVSVEENPMKQDGEVSVLSKGSVETFVKETLETESESNISRKALEIGRTVLQRIVNAITDDTSIEISRQNRQIIFEIKGGASGVLIGKKGQTLEAIQYIVEKIVNKNSSKRIRILIDVEGYLKKKKDSLQRLATKLVDKVRRTKKPVSIGQMNAHDRRIVHTYLKDEIDVITQSVGTGYYRKLMIFPPKKRDKKS